MKKPTGQIKDPSKLRQTAEQKLNLTHFTDIELTENHEKKLLHELQVHQIELEMLNENLSHAHAELEKSWACYYDLYNLAPVGYLTVDEHDNIQNANLTAIKLLGKTRKALLKKPLTQFISTADKDQFYLLRKRLLDTGASEAIELHLLKNDGENFWVRLEINRFIQPDGELLFRVVFIDINEQKAMDEYLRQAAALFETAREGVIVTDANIRITAVNGAFCRITGFSSAEVIGQTPEFLKSGRHDDAFYQAMWDTLNNTGYWQGEIWNRRKSGEIYPQMLSVSAVRNEDQQVRKYIAVYSDISQIKADVVRLDFIAHHDPLTGLPNRLMLMARLEHCLESSIREHKSAALLMLDLDRFKDINDSFGHLAGDELLQQVANRLMGRLRGVDTVTRLGGDEFALLLENLAHPQDAAIVASDIISAFNEPWRLSNGAVVRIGVSIGISLFPDHGKTVIELLKQADAALYRAKAEGRNRFNYFSEDLTKATIRQINLETKLRRAIFKGELSVQYQPQIDITTGTIIGAEALLRWHNAEEGTISPSQFIPVAENCGLISEIGEWVLWEVCRQGKRWLDKGLPPLRLAVNLSLHQFRHGDIETSLKTILHDTGFPPENMELELTESALMEREHEAVKILDGLRALGIRLAIDDFGTGYSSLAYLRRFPLDQLKIDRSFIEEIPANKDDKEIVTAIISMAHALRLQVLAEGVETEAQLNFLKELGCDYYQGCFKSPAITPNDFVALFN